MTRTPLLLGLALLLSPGIQAAEPTAELETVAQIRHDLWGDPWLPVWSYVKVRKEVHGPVAYGYGVDAYVGLEWAGGIDQPSDFDLYSLNVEGEQAWGRWVVGRQRAFGALRPQTFDGLRLDWRASDALSFSVWGGEARHQDLDDLRDGVHMGRVDGTFHGGGLVARAGVQVEVGPDTPLITRQDLEARATAQDWPLHPDLLGRLSVAEAENTESTNLVTTPELARVELGVRPIAALRANLHAEHREAADPDSLFGEAILESLAGGAVNSAGVGLRVSGERFAALYGSWSLVSYGPRDVEWYGHEIDLHWVSGLDHRTWRLTPGYLFRSGPGGLFHAPSLAGKLDLGDFTTVGARLAVVPYRKLHGSWELATTLGLDGSLRPTEWVSFGARLDISADALFALDVRGTGVLTLAVP